MHRVGFWLGWSAQWMNYNNDWMAVVFSSRETWMPEVYELAKDWSAIKN